MPGPQRNLEKNTFYINRFSTGSYEERSPLYSPLSAQGLTTIARLDTIWRGLNMELNARGTLQRRFGYILSCAQQFGTTEWPLAFYSYKNLAGAIRPMVDTQSTVYNFTTTSLNAIFSKNTTQQTSFQKVGDILYFCDGVDAKKWDGSVNLLAKTEKFDDSTWTKLTDGTGSTSVTADATISPLGTLTADQLNFTTHTGGQHSSVVQFLTLTTAAVRNRTVTGSVWLKANSSVTVQLDVTDNTFSQTVATLQAAVTTSWQRFSLTGTFNSSANGGMALFISSPIAPSVLAFNCFAWGAQLEYGGGVTDYQAVDAGTGGPVPVRNWQVAAPVAAPSLTFSSGSLSPTSGYQYVYLYRTERGGASTASPISANTGIQTSKNISVAYTASSDAQVTAIEIYRTDDGGSLFYFLASVANTSSSYTDSTADTGLNDDIVAPMDHQNDPPPTGISIVKFYQGRMFVAVGNIVYFAGGPDVTNGVPEECFPPANFFKYPGRITAMAATTQGLIVFTNDNAYTITGGPDTASFTSDPWQSNFGVAQQNCVTQDGDLVFVYTTNKQLWQVDTSLTEIGFPIRSRLSVYDPALVCLSVHRSGSDEGLFISNGSTDIWRYSLALGAWSPVAQPVGGNNAIQSIEVTNANFCLLMGRAAGSLHIFQRDTSTFTDNGATFTGFGTIGSLVTAAPGTFANINSVLIQCSTTGTYPTIGVLLNEISGTFVTLPNPVADPPQLPASTTVSQKRHYFKAASTPLPQAVCHMQIKISIPAEAAMNEILAIGVGYAE